MGKNSEIAKEIARQIAAGVQSFNDSALSAGMEGVRAITPTHFEMDGVIYPINGVDVNRKMDL